MAETQLPITTPVGELRSESVFERYTVGEEIAHGGMGAIYRTRDVRLGRDVAVKVLHERYAAIPEVVDRFVEEARITGQLQHPGIPPIHDYGILADGRHFLAMKLIKGRTLAELLAPAMQPPLDQARRLQIFEQVCQTVAYAHSRGVIHRDLKPANVMVGAFGEVQVMDWGLAKVLGESPVATARRAEPSGLPVSVIDAGRNTDAGSNTEAGTVLGTYPYMPPEQARGELERLDQRADVWALGAILCEMLTGDPPYTGGRSVLRALAELGAVEDALARLAASGAEPVLADLVRRCLAKDLANRPIDGGVVADAITSFRASVEARLQTAEREKAVAQARATEQRRKRRWQLAVAGAVLILIAGGSLVAVWAGRQETDRARVDGERKAEQAAADSERRIRSEQTRVNVADADRLATKLRKEYRFKDASDVLTTARHLLGTEGNAEHGPTLNRAEDDRAFVVELDAIRMKSATINLEWDRDERLLGPRQYREAFRARGYAIVEGDVQELSARIARSEIAFELVEALDDWSAFETDMKALDRVLAVARTARPDPWGDRFRNRMNKANKVRVMALLADADPERLTPSEAGALAAIAASHQLDPASILVAAQARHPDDFALAVILGNWFLPRDLDRAIGYYRAALAIRPNNPAVLTNLGYALYYDKDSKGSTAAYRKVVALEPNNARAHLNLGIALVLSDDAKSAEAEFVEVIRLDPQLPEGHCNLGGVLGKRSDWTGMAAASQIAIDLRPKRKETHGMALANLGAARWRLKDLPGAVESLQQAARIYPTAATYFNLGQVLASQGELDAAATAFEDAIRLDPKDAQARRSLGYVREDQAARDKGIAPLPREVKRP